jgi:uncharacterized protein
VSAAEAPRIESIGMRGSGGFLEGMVRWPARDVSRAALLCHPHPLYGGSMHSPVLFRASRALHRRGFATLRFNFRGVGRSAGSFDAGKGEKEDVLTALETLWERFPGTSVTLVGYSFGAFVGFQAAGGDPRVRRLVGIGVPTQLWSFDFLKGIEKPLLVIQGSDDPFGPIAALRSLLDPMGSRAVLAILPGGGHSLSGELDALEEAVYRETAE